MTDLWSHRGNNGIHSYQENTPEAMAEVIRSGAGGIEIDVHLLNGEAVVCHDIPEGGANLPRLEAFFDVMGQTARQIAFNIEIKDPAAVNRTIEITRKAIGQGLINLDKVLVSSFKSEALMNMRNSYPEVPIGVLTWENDDRKFSEILGLAEQVKAKSINADFGMLRDVLQADRSELMKEIRASAGEIVVWTAQNQADIDEAIGWGVDVIISDHVPVSAYS